MRLSMETVRILAGVSPSRSYPVCGTVDLILLPGERPGSQNLNLRRHGRPAVLQPSQRCSVNINATRFAQHILSSDGDRLARSYCHRRYLWFGCLVPVLVF